MVYVFGLAALSLVPSATGMGFLSQVTVTMTMTMRMMVTMTVTMRMTVTMTVTMQ